MTTLFLVRHAKTAWNAERRFVGRSDPPLSAEGRRQAEAVGRRLGAEELSLIYSSTRRRAIETASAVAAPKNLALQPVPEFDEFDFGEWEGLTAEEIEAVNPGLVDRWLNDPTKVQVPGGEPWQHFEERVRRGLELVIGRSNGEKGIALVAHGGSLRLALSLLLGRQFSLFGELWQVHGGITALALESNQGDPRAGLGAVTAHVISLNSTDHFSQD